MVKQTENLNQDVLIKGYIHSNNYSNNNNNNNSNNNSNGNGNNYGTGVGKVESSAYMYHGEPCPSESGVAPLASGSNPLDTPVRVTAKSQ